MERTQIPMPLQTQILIRLALAVCSLVAGNVCLVFFTMTIAVPFFLLALLTAVSACLYTFKTSTLFPLVFILFSNQLTT